MMRILLLSLGYAAIFVGSGLAAGSQPIGIAMGTGNLSVDDIPVTGQFDVSNGAELQTTVAPSDIHLDNGVDVRLASRSTITLYQDRVILKAGAVEVNHFDSYPVETGGLTIQADSFNTEATIRTSPKAIEIASIAGTVRVSDAGAMMTRVATGTRMAFQNSGASGQGQSGQTPSQTGAAPAPAPKAPMSDKKAILWTAGICAVAAIVIGSIAASQGKSPF